jgi:tRNA A37 methylthiotransferase MiaB
MLEEDLDFLDGSRIKYFAPDIFVNFISKVITQLLILKWCHLFMQEGSLFVLYVMLRSSKLQHLLLRSWYHWKALAEQGCTKLVS